MGLDPSEEELQDMIREVDEDQSGSISFKEFVGTSQTFNTLFINQFPTSRYG
jgi:Ca2+-binding EF-hand superfamily protein